MDWIKKLKISKKLNLLVIVNLVFLIIVGGLGIYCAKNLSKSIDNMYSQALIPTKDILVTKKCLGLSSANNVMLIIDPSKQNISEHLNNLANIDKEGFAALTEYQSSPGISDEEKIIFPKMKKHLMAYLESRDHSTKLATQGKKQEAWKYYIDKTEKNWFLADAVFGELENIVIKNANKNYQNAIKTAKTIIDILIIIGLFASVLIITLGIFITSLITLPIKNAIEKLNQGTKQVTNASMQVADASRQLAEGTSEQAAGIQETSATLEETASMVRQNAENTKQASFLANEVKDFADKSLSDMDLAMKSMEELKNSSNEIGKIINVIEDIAFQTNILSLNAAVEAARAGDSGKGFAIVAEEVRNLAQRSSEAAKNTAVIIESNLSLSNGNVEKAKHIQEAFKKINEQTKKVNDLLNEISIATNEQTQGVDQINQTIAQMEIVLGTNADMAEESASASKTLSDQAVNVKETVNSLIVLVDGEEAVYRYK